MTLPSLVLGFVIATLYGAGFHLYRGGGAGRLILYLFLSWVGFWIGNTIASSAGWRFGQVGPINVLTGSMVSLIFLGIGHWLSLVEVEKK
jgi:hypothetical protein